MSEERNVVEVPKDQYDLLIRANQLLQKAWNDPKVGEQTRRLINQIDPTVPIPEQIGDRIADTRLKPVEEELSSIKEQVTKFVEAYEGDKKAATERDAEKTLLDRINRVKEQFRFTDEGMDLVIKRMQEQKSADVEGAAAFIAREYAPPPEPPSGQSGLFPVKANLFGAAGGSTDESIQALHKDPLAWQDATLTQMLNELSTTG